MGLKRMSRGNLTVTMDMTKLEFIQAALKKKLATRVGILGNKGARLAQNEGETHKQYKKRVRRFKEEIKDNGGPTNAEIGFLHENGSAARNIPKRSFLKMPLFLKAADLTKDTVRIGKHIKEGNVLQLFKELGIKAEIIIQKAFATRGFGKWEPNAPLTIARKGSDAPLIDTAQLRKSITSQVVKI